MRENKIESEVCNYAETLGWLQFKFSSPNQKGVPDRIFIRNGAVLFIEFKATGANPTKLQRKKIREILTQGVRVFVIDNIGEGKKLFNSFDNIC
jgi:Holliday junction resolvase